MLHTFVLHQLTCALNTTNLQTQLVSDARCHANELTAAGADASSKIPSFDLLFVPARHPVPRQAGTLIAESSKAAACQKLPKRRTMYNVKQAVDNEQARVGSRVVMGGHVLAS